jgi:hypothetical protein
MTMAPRKQTSVAIPPPVHAWDRRPAESGVAWEAFVAYRDLGASRTHATVGTSLGKSTTLMSRWASVHEWTPRVELWEVEQDRVRQRAALDSHRIAVVDMGGRHSRIAEEWLIIMERMLREALTRILAADAAAGEGNAGRPFGGLDMADLVGLIRMIGTVMPRVAEMERLARGITPSEAVDENKLRATIKAEYELAIDLGDAPSDPQHVATVIRTLVEAGAIPGIVLAADSVEAEYRELDDYQDQEHSNGHSNGHISDD